MAFRTIQTVFNVVTFSVIPLVVRCKPQWSDKDAYNETLGKLAGLFRTNFEKFSAYSVGEDSELSQQILDAGPRVA